MIRSLAFLLTVSALLGGAFLLRVRHPTLLAGAGLAILVLLPLVWFVVCAISPAKAQRACPRCGRNRLARIAPGARMGIQCKSCGYEDAYATTAFLDD